MKSMKNNLLEFGFRLLFQVTHIPDNRRHRGEVQHAPHVHVVDVHNVGVAKALGIPEGGQRCSCKTPCVSCGGPKVLASGYT